MGKAGPLGGKEQKYFDSNVTAVRESERLIRKSSVMAISTLTRAVTKAASRRFTDFFCVLRSIVLILDFRAVFLSHHKVSHQGPHNMIPNFLRDFLACRSLTAPDGRPLYAYRIEPEEFEDLELRLIDYSAFVEGNATKVPPNTEALFVLYASEWWRRRYEGGFWSWGPILESICWESLERNELIKAVSTGLGVWRRPLRRLSHGTGFLLSIQCEGGLPIQVLERDSSYISRYLKALLDDIATFSGRGLTEQGLAEGLRHHLPATLRNDAIYQLAGELVSFVYTLAQQLTSKADPVAELDQSDPTWRQRLPLNLESEAANLLIKTLLAQAKKRQSGASAELSVSRDLVLRNGVFEPVATIEIPSSIPVAYVANLISVTGEAPARLELVAKSTRELRTIASLQKVDDDYQIYPIKRDFLVFNEPLTNNVSVFVSVQGRLIGQMPVKGSDGCDYDLPLVFRHHEDQGHRLRLIGTGSSKSRFEQLIVALAPDMTFEADKPASVSVIDDVISTRPEWTLIETSQTIKINLADATRVTITPAEDRDLVASIRVMGKGSSLLEHDNSKLVVGVPTFLKLADGGLWRAIKSTNVVFKSYRSSDPWRPCSEGVPIGKTSFRVVEEGESVYSTTAVVLPAGFLVTLKPGEDANCGSYEINGLDGAVLTVVNDGLEVEYSKPETTSAPEVLVTLNRTSDEHISRVGIKLRWESGGNADFTLPFPAVGASFTADGGRAISNLTISLSDMISATATAVSFGKNDRFFLSAALIAKDLPASITRRLSFSKELIREGDNFNLPLYQFQRTVKELFSYSADIDAAVLLEISSAGQIYARVRVSQFDAELLFDPISALITCTTESSLYDVHEDFPDLAIESYSVTNYGDTCSDWLPEAGSHTWIVDSDTLVGTPLIVAAAQPYTMRVRPCVVDCRETAKNQVEGLPLILAINCPETRQARLDVFLSNLSNASQADSEWDSLVQAYKYFEPLHGDCIDLISRLVDYPKVMFNLLLRLGPSGVTSLTNLQETIPFRWWLLPVDAIISTVTSYHQYLRGVIGNDQVYESACLPFKDLMDQVFIVAPQLKVAQELLAHSGYASAASKPMLSSVRTKLKAAYSALQGDWKQSVVNAHADDMWPNAFDRADALSSVGLKAGEFLWLDSPREPAFRRPFFDSITFAAGCTARGLNISIELRALLCVSREFSPREFDRLFSFAQAIHFAAYEART